MFTQYNRIIKSAGLTLLALTVMGILAACSAAPTQTVVAPAQQAISTKAATATTVPATATVESLPTTEPTMVMPTATHVPNTVVPKPTATEDTSPALSGVVNINIADSDFLPDVVKVKVGTKVIWTNGGGYTHTVTADDGSFTKRLSSGETFEHVFNTAGEFPYYCQIHGGSGGQGMSGKVIVVP